MATTKSAPKAAPAAPRKSIRTASTIEAMRRAIAGKTTLAVLEASTGLSAAKKALVLDALYLRLIERATKVAA